MLIRLLKEMLIIALGTFALFYLMFPTLGVFELIPDAIPLVGSIDEAGATLIIANVLSYYGIDLTRLFVRGEPSEQREKSVRATGSKKVVRRVRRIPKPQAHNDDTRDVEDAEYIELPRHRD